jgi:RNA polymerase sigma-70 factor (ECF subfamily)
MISTKTYTDSELLGLLQNGDKEAFAVLYEKYWQPVLVYVMRAVRVQSDAEDIVQELFISLWKRRETLDIKAAFSTYLYNSARYMSIRYIEKNITRTHYLASLASEEEGGHSVPADQKVLLEEINAKIETAMAQMPERMQMVFRLSREQHLSYREIAQRLEISEETVRKQIYKALKYLRAQLADMPFMVLYALSFLLFL